MVVVEEVTLGESMWRVFGGGRGGVPIAVFRGPCARVVLLALGHRRRLCIGCGVGQASVRDDIGALGGELEDDAPFCRLLWGPLLGFALWPLEGDLLAPSPAVVGVVAEDCVLLRVLDAFYVRRPICDVSGVLLLPFLSGGAWRGGGCVPEESFPRDVGQVMLGGRPVLNGALAGLKGGVVAPQGVGQVRRGRPFTGWGPRGGRSAESRRGRGARGRVPLARVPARFGPCGACVVCSSSSFCRLSTSRAMRS